MAETDLLYDVGTVAVNNGSATVTGTGTLWNTPSAAPRIKAGDTLVVTGSADKNSYKIKTVNSDTSLTLERAFQGSNGSGLAYHIYKDSVINRADTALLMEQVRAAIVAIAAITASVTITANANAVNKIGLADATAGNAPEIAVTGSDTNVSLRYTTQGTGEHIWKINGADELRLSAAALYPHTNDGLALGKSGNAFSDAFLAAGAVINFDAGNYSLTHAAGSLTAAGGPFNAPSFVPTGATVPANGVYLPAANTLGIATNSTLRVQIRSDGNIGINGSGIANAKLFVLGDGTGGATAYGIISRATIKSDVTLQFAAFASQTATDNAAFTLGTLHHFYAVPLPFGASSTVTTQAGFTASSALTGAATNYGFWSAIAAASGRWNFYASGTARNHMMGALSIGATTDPGTGGLHVQGATNIADNTAASSTTTGSLKNAGGFGNAGAAYIGGNLVATGTNVLFGYTAAIAVSSFTPFLQNHGTDSGASSQGLFNWANSAAQPLLTFAKSRGGIGAHTIVQNGDVLGTIGFYGSDGSSFIPAASIVGYINGTPGTNDMPGAMNFRTTSDGAASLTTRMVLITGLQLGTPTGGDKGQGTVNAVGVYDDNVLLTCFGVEYLIDGRIDVAKWDGFATNGRHQLVHRFLDMVGGGDFDPRDHKSYIAKMYRDRALPGMPSQSDWSHNALSVGEMVDRLWLAQELQVGSIVSIASEVEGLAAELAAAQERIAFLESKL